MRVCVRGEKGRKNCTSSTSAIISSSPLPLSGLRTPCNGLGVFPRCSTLLLQPGEALINIVSGIDEHMSQCACIITWMSLRKQSTKISASAARSTTSLVKILPDIGARAAVPIMYSPFHKKCACSRARRRRCWRCGACECPPSRSLIGAPTARKTSHQGPRCGIWRC